MIYDVDILKPRESRWWLVPLLLMSVLVLLTRLVDAIAEDRL